MEYRAMTKSDVYRLARSFGSESNRSFAVLKKVGGAHIELGSSRRSHSSRLMPPRQRLVFRWTGDGMPAAAAGR
jgi:hypothetical protein